MKSKSPNLSPEEKKQTIEEIEREFNKSIEEFNALIPSTDIPIDIPSVDTEKTILKIKKKLFALYFKSRTLGDEGLDFCTKIMKLYNLIQEFQTNDRPSIFDEILKRESRSYGLETMINPSTN